MHDRVSARVFEHNVQIQMLLTGTTCTQFQLWDAIRSLDYLAAHEVSHLVELNHSPRFWRLVKRLYPQLERAKVWLDANGTDLHRYGLPHRRSAKDI